MLGHQRRLPANQSTNRQAQQILLAQGLQFTQSTVEIVYCRQWSRPHTIKANIPADSIKATATAPFPIDFINMLEKEIIDFCMTKTDLFSLFPHNTSKNARFTAPCLST